MGKLKALLIEEMEKEEIDRKDYYFRLKVALKTNGFDEEAIKLIGEMKTKGYTDEVHCVLHDFDMSIIYG